MGGFTRLTALAAPNHAPSLISAMAYSWRLALELHADMHYSLLPTRESVLPIPSHSLDLDDRPQDHACSLINQRPCTHN